MRRADEGTGDALEVVAPADTAQTYDYDPYGNALQTPSSGPLTDFRFAGMFFEPNSGLYLTRTRVYDPSIARWLSRDSLGETSDPTGNLYRYVEGNPTSLTDPSGRQLVAALIAAATFVATELTSQPANAPGPCSPLLPVSPLAPITNGAAAGLGIIGAAAAWEAVASAEAQAVVDASKLTHIFGNPEHGLDALVEQYGNQQSAYTAISKAVTEQMGTGTGTYSTVVNVAGTEVRVTGAYVNGVPRIGTAFVPRQ